ncbi:MAG: transposase [Clostridiales bacterium]|nr:transposase [Clostridiales bacterium]
MNNQNRFQKRKNLRLQYFDYNTPGAYFITICTHNRECTLSHIVGSIHESTKIRLTEYGKIVDKYINNIPSNYNATIEQYVIMPNHIHLIIAVNYNEEIMAIRESPLQGRSIISKMIGYIKMNASKEIHYNYGTKIVWQRGFHDHIIRGRKDYEKISKYIYENPITWQCDCLYRKE